MLILTASSLSNAPRIAHGFFGRGGGVSKGIFASLNCGPGSGDERADVIANRKRVVDALVPGAALLTLHQIHSGEAVSVTAPWNIGEGPKADAMATNMPGLALGVLTADCAPVLFADAEAGVIGAAHAGWKGALGGVTDSAIAAMESLGARRERIAAAIGPCISQANYEVGPEFRDRFPESFFDGRTFDLEAYVAERLAAARVQNVARLNVCTYAREADFFSFRRATHRGEADYGRQVSAIVLRT
jgi:YfiH family protein